MKPPLDEAERGEHKKQGHDVEIFREDDRGDVIRRLPLAAAIATGQRTTPPKREETPGTVRIARSSESADDVAVSPDGKKIAFATGSLSGRMESIAENELWVVDARSGELRQLTHNQANERDVVWSRDSKRILFSVHGGSVEGKYEDVQGRIYSIDPATAKIEKLETLSRDRWMSRFCCMMASSSPPAR